MRVTYHDGAIAELREAVAFYNERSAGLGFAFLDDVRTVLAEVSVHPGMGVAVRPAVRRALLSRFPYSILYHSSEARILVLAVMHHRRKPGYWVNRI